MQVSHETIYKSLFIQSRGVLKKRNYKSICVAVENFGNHAREIEAATEGR